MSAAPVEVVPMLPAAWVDRIFAKLTVRYGTAFRARYAGVEEQMLHADWAEQLAWFRRHPDAIAYALNNLPDDRAPTVAEFRRLCNQAPQPVAALLSNSQTRKPPPPEVAEKLKAFQNRITSRGAA
ncbi:MAG: hypothetical protein RLZZ373_3268 [Pseudomonadota bacterium]|jgi:hypothetical protein